MLPIIPVLLGGAALFGGTVATRALQQRPIVGDLLVKKLSVASPSASADTYLLPQTFQQCLHKLETQIGGLYTEITDLGAEMVHDVAAYCTKLDDRYQRFVQERIDPILIGQQHQQQLQELSAMNLRELTPPEKYANRTFIVSVVGMGALTLARWGAFPLHPLLDGIVLYLLYPTYRLAWQSAVTQRRLHIIQFGAIYTTGMWIGGYYAIGMIGTVFFNLCLKIMSMIENQGRYQLVNVFSQQPRTVWVLIDGAEVEIPFAQLHTGSTLVLNAGQVVPCDGVIVEGTALIDQHVLTGEAQPVEKTVGDSVLAATLLILGKIYLHAEKTGTETTAAQIGEILNQTRTYHLSIEAETFERSNQLLKPTLALSALAWLFAGPYAAAAMFGCNLTGTVIGLAPLTMLNFLNRLARQSILIKDGRVLEKLPTIDTIVFDKTGTLTMDRPHVAKIHVCSHVNEAELLRLAAAAEHRQSHPIAQAILAAATERQLTLPAIDEARYEVGYGIRVGLASQTVHVGSARYLAMEGIELPSSFQTLQTDCHAQGHSVVFISQDHIVVGAIELQPTLRSEVNELLEGLRKRNLRLYIISGDQDAPTRQLADTLGMDGYFANVLPTGKAALVAELQEAGHKVCFIGDGINDAIALKKADVSISLRGATTAATDTAEVILMADGLQKLLPLLTEAEHFNRDLDIIFRSSVALSVLSVGSVLFTQLAFTSVQVFAMLNFGIGIGVANKAWLRRPEEF